MARAVPALALSLMMPCLNDGLQPGNPEERWYRIGFRLTSLEESTSPPNPREKKKIVVKVYKMLRHHGLKASVGCVGL